jgi:hypothetical protein
MVEHSVNVYWKKQYEHYRGNPPREASVVFFKKAGTDREFKDSGQIDEEDSLRNPRRQHLRHGFCVNEMSDTRKDEQKGKSDRGSTLRIVVTLRHDRQGANE